MTRILVLGADGQLGRELRRARPPALSTLMFAGRSEFDITSADARSIIEMKPDAIINAAAYTNVDKAESESKLAFAVNCEGAAALASAAAATGVPLIHVSTDYVFDGKKEDPYVETDAKAPLGVYGRSKADGEERVLAHHDRAVVLRTSWVFSSYGANFVKSMLRRGEADHEVRVVGDQIGRPTAASDLAGACLAIAEKQLAGMKAAAGIFHYAGADTVSWAGFAEAIFSEAAKRGRAPVRVRPITTADYPTAAKRPANSRLDTSKIESELGIVPRPWRETLGRCIDEILAG